MNKILPCLLENDQYIDVVLDAEGKFLYLVPSAPPIYNFTRLPCPHFSDEVDMRKREWAAARMVGYSE